MGIPAARAVAAPYQDKRVHRVMDAAQGVRENLFAKAARDCGDTDNFHKITRLTTPIARRPRRVKVARPRTISIDIDAFFVFYFPSSHRRETMAIDAHLQSLNRRHQELDEALSTEMKRPLADESRTHELKRRKLIVKDQIAALRRRSGAD